MFFQLSEFRVINQFFGKKLWIDFQNIWKLKQIEFWGVNLKLNTIVWQFCQIQRFIATIKYRETENESNQ